MALVKIVVTMHNTKKIILENVKNIFRIKKCIMKFLNIKSIAILKMQTKKLIKNGPGKI